MERKGGKREKKHQWSREDGNVKFMKMLIRIYFRGTIMEYKFANDLEL
jgi:hypothetical protein